MQRLSSRLLISLITAVILGCATLSPRQNIPLSISDDRIAVSNSGFSFKLPEENWSADSSKYQSNEAIEYFSFTRDLPISFGDEQAYFPTISIITETLESPTDINSYDSFILSSVEDLGMVVEVISDLQPGGGLLPDINAVGRKVLVHTKQGDSMGYMIHIVRGLIGIRFILESTPENFDKIEPEFVEMIESIQIEP